MKKNIFLRCFITVSLLINYERSTNFRSHVYDEKIIKYESLTTHVKLQEKEHKGRLHIEEPHSIIFRYSTKKACFSSYNRDVVFCFQSIEKLITANIKHYDSLFAVCSKKSRSHIKSLAKRIYLLLMRHTINHIIKSYKQYKFL